MCEDHFSQCCYFIIDIRPHIRRCGKTGLISMTNDGSVKSCLMYLATQYLLLDAMTDDDMMCLKYGKKDSCQVYNVCPDLYILKKKTDCYCREL